MKNIREYWLGCGQEDRTVRGILPPHNRTVMEDWLFGQAENLEIIKRGDMFCINLYLNDREALVEYKHVHLLLEQACSPMSLSHALAKAVALVGVQKIIKKKEVQNAGK